MNAQSRALLMARLGQNAGMDATSAGESVPAPPAPSNPMAAPTLAAMNPSLAAAAQAGLAAASSAVVPPQAPPNGGSLDRGTSFCILIKNMFDPATETEAGWDQDIKVRSFSPPIPTRHAPN